MERALLESKLDRLVTYRLSTTGLASLHWAEVLGDVERDPLMRAVIEVVKIVVPDWEAEQSGDLRARRAVEAAEAWLAQPSDEALAHAKACAKACTAARNDTFGRGHRVPEAARAVARAAGALDGTHLFDALESTEGELLARIVLVGEYERGPAQRALIVSTLRRVLCPPIAAPAAAAPLAVDTTPVPYAASGRFVVGQRLEHKKFGLVKVVQAEATSIEVELAYGTKKKLVHAPAK